MMELEKLEKVLCIGKVSTFFFFLRNVDLLVMMGGKSNYNMPWGIGKMEFKLRSKMRAGIEN